jgi:hypothetical protein
MFLAGLVLISLTFFDPYVFPTPSQTYNSMRPKKQSRVIEGEGITQVLHFTAQLFVR